MNLKLPMLEKSNSESHEYLFCPSEQCLNIPIIEYQYNPLKNDIQYKCICQDNNNAMINMNLQEFLEKSNITCHDCKRIIEGENFYICSDCKNYFDAKCSIFHGQNNNHTQIVIENKRNIMNVCKEHKNNFMFKCRDCNVLLCIKCNIDFHDDNDHTLIQLRK